MLYRSRFAPLSVLLVLLAFTVIGNPARAQQEKPSEEGLKIATFAGGCFWCMQYAFDRAPGVKKTVVGYTGGKKDQPDYEDVSSGTTGHAEAIEVFYDPKETSFGKLLDVFWRNIDPTTKNGQFADRGTQYRTAIFYHNDEEKRQAEASRDALAKSGKFNQPIATEITPAKLFFAAEDYHQGYYQKNAARFHAYEEGSGRAPYLRRTWGSETAANASSATGEKK